MKTLLFVFLVCGLCSHVQSPERRVKEFNLEDGLAIDGYDPVSYFKGSPKKGLKTLTWTYRGIRYQFSTEANRAQFIQAPEQYEPAYGGWCAYAMGATGEKVKIDPETFKIIEGKLYLFYNFWGNNTLSPWNRNEKKLKLNADRSWSQFLQ